MDPSTPVGKLDAVFEGGGVKGIGLVGALSVVEQRGGVFQRVAGTSAGAIVATLIAAGYTAEELQPIIMGPDIAKFIDTSIPVAGPAVDLIAHMGLFKGDYFEEFIFKNLQAKGKLKFGDFIIKGAENEDPRYKYKIHMIASDITRGRMMVLPDDLPDYGIDPDNFEVSRAVRMSMSIPFFFRPVKLEWVDPNGAKQQSLIVDGGLLSNFPVELFDAHGRKPRWPTFGFKTAEVGMHSIHGPISEFLALCNTAVLGHDLYALERLEKDKTVRTIKILTEGVYVTDFKLSDDQKKQLYKNGQSAAQTFLNQWDFNTYIDHYRSSSKPQ